jgi:phospholipase C
MERNGLCDPEVCVPLTVLRCSALCNDHQRHCTERCSCCGCRRERHKHVIVIIGENRSFDHLFATYVPKPKGETVLNLLSEGIVNADGTPGPNYPSATQYQAMDTADAQQIYLLSPPKTGPYTTLPPPLANGGYTDGAAPFSKVKEALTYENGLPPAYYKYLTTGGVPPSILGKPDIRIYYRAPLHSRQQ